MGVYCDICRRNDLIIHHDVVYHHPNHCCILSGLTFKAQLFDDLKFLLERHSL